MKTDSEKFWRDREIAEALRAEEPTIAVAARYGMNRHQVYNIARRNGIKTKRQNTKVARNKDITEAALSGRSYESIAKEFGLSPARAREIAVKGGVQPWAHVNRITDEERQAWADYYRRGYQPYHIPTERSSGVVARALIDMGLHVPEEAPPPRSKEHKQYVRQHYGKKPVRHIAQELGTTRNAIIGLAHRMGLTKPKADSHA